MTSVDTVKVQYIVALRARGFWTTPQEGCLIRRFFDIHHPTRSYVGRQIALLFPEERERWLSDLALFRDDPVAWAERYFE